MSSDPKKVVNLERLRDGAGEPARAPSQEQPGPGEDGVDNLDRLVSDFLEQINSVTAGYEAHGKSRTEDLDLLLESLTDAEETEVTAPKPRPAVEEPAAAAQGNTAAAAPVVEVAPPRAAPDRAELGREIERTLQELERLDGLPASAPPVSSAGLETGGTAPPPAEPLQAPSAGLAAGSAQAALAPETGAAYAVQPAYSGSSPIWTPAAESRGGSRRVLFILLVAILILTLAVTAYYLSVVMQPEASLPADPPSFATEPPAPPRVPQQEETAAGREVPEAKAPEAKPPAGRPDAARANRPERRSAPRAPASTERRSPETASGAPADRSGSAPDAPEEPPELLIPPRRPEPDTRQALAQAEPFLGSSAAIPAPARPPAVGQLQPRRSSIPASPITGPQSSGARSSSVSLRPPTPAEVLSRVLPAYPELARRIGLKGKVDLDIEIDEEGKVTQATPLSGPEVFHSAAVNAVRRWRFKPATINGAAVPSQGRVSVVFDNPR